jgi:predicted Co/Zn/Cd cation transporter (cation efflux family)
MASEGTRRFQFGFWHLEPLVLGFKASILLLLIGYGFVNAVQQMLSGGNAPALGMALVYSAAVTLICLIIWLYVRRQNARLQAETTASGAEGHGG